MEGAERKEGGWTAPEQDVTAALVQHKPTHTSTLTKKMIHFLLSKVTWSIGSVFNKGAASWSNSTKGTELALHSAGPFSTLGAPYGPLSPPRLTPDSGPKGKNRSEGGMREALWLYPGDSVLYIPLA